VSNSNKLKYQLKHHVRQSAPALLNEKFVIIDEDKNTVVESIFKGELIRSVAINKLADYRKANPKDKRNLNVISSFELPEVPLPRA
jgi:hypothetical protein